MAVAGVEGSQTARQRDREREREVVSCSGCWFQDLYQFPQFPALPPVRCYKLASLMRIFQYRLRFGSRLPCWSRAEQVTRVSPRIGLSLIMTDNIIMKISPGLAIHNFFISSNFMLSTNYKVSLLNIISITNIPHSNGFSQVIFTNLL